MEQIEFFKCLSDPTRLQIIKIIIVNKRICVCEFTKLLNITQPKISRHLALLRVSKLLLDEREGQWVYYSINPNIPHWAKLILNIIKNDNSLK